MGFMDWFRHPDINEGFRRCRETPGAVLLDVRTGEEYARGRLPGSRNLPLDQLSRQAASLIPDRRTPLFVYCLSGSRSAQAASLLRRMGYERVENIGGIGQYTGDVER